MVPAEYDVVVIGCGPAGSCLSTYLARAGLSVLAIDKSAFPRYHVGESLTGMATTIIQELGLAEEMNCRDFVPKRGVKAIGTGGRNEFFVPVLNPTWQVRRAEFDEILLNRARKEGVEACTGTIRKVIRDGERVTGVCYRSTNGEEREVHARWVADCTGQSTLFSTLGIASKRIVDPEFGKQQSVFTQFRNAQRDPGELGLNTYIFYSHLHHWAWFIPVSPDVTSVGIVVPANEVRALGGPQKTIDWGLEHLNPELAGRFDDATQVEPARAISNYAYRVKRYVGDGWLCVGDAHQFIDPIFSFGVSFALVEAKKASEAIVEILNGARARPLLTSYTEYCDRGQAVASDLIRYFWKFPTFFGYLARGKTKRDMIRLLGSDCHAVEGIPALDIMRKSLAEVEAQPSPVPEGAAVQGEVLKR